MEVTRTRGTAGSDGEGGDGEEEVEEGVGNFGKLVLVSEIAKQKEKTVAGEDTVTFTVIPFPSLWAEGCGRKFHFGFFFFWYYVFIH